MFLVLAVDNVHEFLDFASINAVTGLESTADNYTVSIFQIIQNIVNLDTRADNDREVAHLFTHALDIFNGNSLVIVVFRYDDTAGIMVLCIIPVSNS